MNKEEIIKENFGKLTYNEIGKLIGLSGRMVRYISRKKLGLGLLKNNQTWSDDEINILKNHYEHNPNIYNLLPNRTKQSIWYKTFSLGLKSEGKGEFTGNVFFFDTWTENMSYILGLICADGNIFKDVLTIVQKNKEYLEKIRDIMEFKDIPIRTNKLGISSLVIRNIILINSLKKLGLTEKKSLILGKIPVPEKFMRSFILGYIDGDGCICSTFDKRRNKNYLEVSMLGTYNFLNWIQAEINNITGIPNRKVQNTNSNIKKIKYGSDNSVKLCSWLYSSYNEIFLKRKKEVFNNFISMSRGNLPIHNTQVNLLKVEDIVQNALIFTNFDRHALYDIMLGTFTETAKGNTDRYKYWKKITDIPAGGRSILLGKTQLDSLGSLGLTKEVANYSDQIPPFTISLTSMNEYGNISAMHILGVELINEGSGVSIDDIVTETQIK